MSIYSYLEFPLKNISRFSSQRIISIYTRSQADSAITTTIVIRIGDWNGITVGMCNAALHVVWKTVKRLKAFYVLCGMVARTTTMAKIPYQWSFILQILIETTLFQWEISHLQPADEYNSEFVHLIIFSSEFLISIRNSMEFWYIYLWQKRYSYVKLSRSDV